MSSEALISFCAEKMPGYMVPKELQIMDILPKMPNGKVDYPELRR